MVLFGAIVISKLSTASNIAIKTDGDRVSNPGVKKNYLRRLKHLGHVTI